MATVFKNPPVIKGEADRGELIETIRAFAVSKNEDDSLFLSEQDIENTLRLLPRAIGYWLANSEPLPDGSLRGEIHRGLIVYAVRKPEFSGEAFGHKFTEAEHFDLYLKFDGAALADLSEELSSPAKNG